MIEQARYEYAEAVRRRYGAAGKREKGRILDEYCRITRCHRKAPIRRLAHAPAAARRRQGRPRRYGPEGTAVLARLWELSDRSAASCSLRCCLCC